MTQHDGYAAHFNADTSGVIIERLDISDRDVSRAAQRWTTKLEPYNGHTPSNVPKDAKYTVSAAGEVRLTYRVDARTKELLTTGTHPKLVKMVNAVKHELNGVPGGVFYINEFGDVLVPGKTPAWTPS